MGLVHIIFAISTALIFVTTAEARFRSVALPSQRSVHHVPKFRVPTAVPPVIPPKPGSPTLIPAIAPTTTLPGSIRMASAAQANPPFIAPVGIGPIGGLPSTVSPSMPASAPMGNAAGGLGNSLFQAPRYNNSSSPIPAPSRSIAPFYDDGRTRTDVASLPPPRIENIDPATAGAFGALRELANRHMGSCGSTRVANRGAVAKVRGYLYGVTNTFARSYCRKPSDPVRQAMGADKGKLIWNYARLTSLGMFESSGGKDVGVDVTNGSSNRHDTAEAGIWQTSYNVRGGLSRNVRAALEGMEREYERNQNSCMYAVYTEGLGRFRDGGIIGSGPGTRFQAMQKRCPALAAETVAITGLHNRAHYGPLKRGEAKALPRCEEMFNSVAALVDRNPEMCAAMSVTPTETAPIHVAEARK